MPGRSCGARSEASTIWRALSWSALKVWANSSCERRFSARNWMSSTISVWMPRNFCRKRSMRRASRAAIISFTKFSAVRHTTVPSGRAWARPVATAESRWVLPSPQPPQRKSGLKRAGLRHHRTCRPVSDAVRLPDDEVVEGVARGRAVRGALGAAGRERAGVRWHAQLPIDQHRDRGPPAARLADRPLDRGEEVLPQPVTRKAARRLERERVGGPAGCTQRRDPRVVVLVEQLAAQPSPRLDPDGVQHPRPHFEPDPRRASEAPPRNAPQAGEKSPNSPTRAFTRL